jgi:hypothetical protein
MVNRGVRNAVSVAVFLSRNVLQLHTEWYGPENLFDSLHFSFQVGAFHLILAVELLYKQFTFKHLRKAAYSAVLLVPRPM